MDQAEDKSLYFVVIGIIRKERIQSYPRPWNLRSWRDQAEVVLLLNPNLKGLRDRRRETGFNRS